MSKENKITTYNELREATRWEVMCAIRTLAKGIPKSNTAEQAAMDSRSILDLSQALDLL